MSDNENKDLLISDSQLEFLKSQATELQNTFRVKRDVLNLKNEELDPELESSYINNIDKDLQELEDALLLLKLDNLSEAQRTDVTKKLIETKNRVTGLIMSVEECGLLKGLSREILNETLELVAALKETQDYMKVATKKAKSTYLREHSFFK